MTKTIKHTWQFRHTPDKVWEYLTDAALLSQWLMPNDIHPVVGHKFRFTTSAMPNFNFDGIIHCEVLEAIPPQRLVYTWKGGPGDGTINLDTVVTWTLTPTVNGTNLTIEQSGFTEANELIYNAMNQGWQKNIAERMSALINKDL